MEVQKIGDGRIMIDGEIYISEKSRRVLSAAQLRQLNGKNFVLVENKEDGELLGAGFVYNSAGSNSSAKEKKQGREIVGLSFVCGGVFNLDYSKAQSKYNIVPLLQNSKR